MERTAIGRTGLAVTTLYFVTSAIGDMPSTDPQLVVRSSTAPPRA